MIPSIVFRGLYEKTLYWKLTYIWWYFSKLWKDKCPWKYIRSNNRWLVSIIGCFSKDVFHTFDRYVHLYKYKNFIYPKNKNKKHIFLILKIEIPILCSDFFFLVKTQLWNVLSCTFVELLSCSKWCNSSKRWEKQAKKKSGPPPDEVRLLLIGCPNWPSVFVCLCTFLTLRSSLWVSFLLLIEIALYCFQ